MACLGLKALIERLIKKSSQDIRLEYFKEKYYLYRESDFSDFAFQLNEKNNNYEIRDFSGNHFFLNHIELINYIKSFIK